MLTGPRLRVCMEHTGEGKGRDGALFGQGLFEFEALVYDGRNKRGL